MPYVENLNKEVEVRMADPKQRPPHRYNTLLREWTDLTVTTAVGVVVRVIQAIIPVRRGLDMGTATV